MPTRSFCIHAHFYQPPREDPLTGVIPRENGATPFHNWNERIHAECYRPNAELRNFEQISFNLGPTLSSWMASYDAATLGRIIDQDRINLNRYGVGNAMSQPYHHTILPLASTQDKITQIAWGVADFEHRFRHKPKGMWLPETAVDYETLELLTSQGIEYTVLAPWQSNQDETDPTEPYIVPLSNGKQITVFFYQRDLSAKVSFDSGATVNADSFAQDILQSYFPYDKSRNGESQLLLVASDGELYGHHQRMRDRFLARLVDGATSPLDIRPTYPAHWLKLFPPREKIGIREDTSWSCHHGVSRWNGQCACTPGDGKWKAQMRLTFDRLSDEINRIYWDVVSPFVRNPWELRQEYIQVILGKISLNSLLAEQSNGKTIFTAQVKRIYLMLKAQYECQRMYASCGWFFDDFDRIEPKNNVVYAAQAVHLTQLATGIDLQDFIQEDLHRIVSRKTRLRADQVFRKHRERAKQFALLDEGLGYY